MNLTEWARQMVQTLPSDSSGVTLTRADLRALIAGEGDGASPALPERDLTIEEVAEEVQRAPSTVRGWLIAGELRGYKLNRRAWRVTRPALREYLAAQAEGPKATERQTAGQPVDISEWRRAT